MILCIELEIFWVNKVILFTQDFHLKRAMYIAKRLWFETYWIETNLHRYFKEKYNFYREILARVKAFLEVEIFKTWPKFLWETIKIVSDEEIEEVKKILMDWESDSGSVE